MPCLSSKTLTLPFILLLVGSVWSQDRNFNLLQRNQYFKAISGWDKVLTSGAMSESGYRALKGQALAFEKLGALYKTFHKLNIDLTSAFYSKMEDHTSSSILYLYRCEIEYYRNNFKKAIQYCERVLSRKKLNSLVRDMANVYRHYSRAGLRGSTMNMASKSKHPAVRWQIAVFNGDEKVPSGLTPKGVRSLRCKLILSVRAESSEDEVRTLIKEILKKSNNAELYLNKKKLTQINFYDPEIFQALSQGFFYVAKLKNEELLKYQGQFPKMAKKFRINGSFAEVLFELGRYQEAAKLVASSSTKQGLILAAKIKTKLNLKKDAEKLLDKALSADKNAPDVMRDVGFAYFETGLNMKKALKLTAKAAKGKKKASYHQKHAAVLAIKKETEFDALEAYSRGYKIQYRNEIEHNAPQYMAEYSYALFRISKMRYEEVIETMYHLQKDFPACRQLHYTIQGVAAAEAQIWGTTSMGKSH